MSQPGAPKGHRTSQTPELTTLAPGEPATILFELEGSVFARWHNLIIAVWATQATPYLISELAEHVRQLARDHGRFSSIHLIVNRAQLPAAEGRESFAALATQYDERLACVATMIEGSGFWASAMRSFVTGMAVLERRRFKLKMCATVNELAHWLAAPHSSSTGVQVDAEQLEQMLDGLLARPTVSKREV